MVQPHYHPCSGDCPNGLLAGSVGAAEREQVLREVYWKLRNHAEGLRNTAVYRSLKERDAEAKQAGVHALGSDWRARLKFAGLERHARGIEAAARDVAELLGLEEYDIEPIAEEKSNG